MQAHCASQHVHPQLAIFGRAHKQGARCPASREPGRAGQQPRWREGLRDGGRGSCGVPASSGPVQCCRCSVGLSPPAPGRLQHVSLASSTKCLCLQVLSMQACAVTWASAWGFQKLLAHASPSYTDAGQPPTSLGQQEGLTASNCCCSRGSHMSRSPAAAASAARSI